MILVLIGFPGSGKGTQSSYLSETLNYPVISTGDMFRKLIKMETNEGKLLNKYIDKGELVPSELVNNVVKKILSLPEYFNGCIIDGYPRNLQQAEFLNSIVDQIIAVYFEINESLILKRLLGRFNCLNCGKIYNKFYRDLKINGVCDICKSTDFLYRKDDIAETINERINIFKKETLPILEFYEKKKKLYPINAGVELDEVKNQLNFVLKNI